MKLAHQITSNTLVDYPRLIQLLDFLEETSLLAGNVAEVGVYKGGTAYLLSQNTAKQVYLFDTFQGMPKVKEGVDLHHEGDFADTSYEQVAELLKEFSNVTITKGLFPKDSGNIVASKQFSLVHLDCDIYDSVKEALEFFYPRMLSGGIIVFDDYAEPNCPGAKLAVDQFFQDKPQKPFLTTQSQAAVRI